MKAQIDKRPVKIEMTKWEADAMKDALAAAAKTTTDDWGQTLMWLHHALEEAELVAQSW